MEKSQAMKQTTTLITKIYESSLDWNIERFMEYPQCDVPELKSELIEIDGFDSSWQVTVYPKADHAGNVRLRFIFFDQASLGIKKLLKFEVHAPIPNPWKPASWKVNYSPVMEQSEFYCEDFINHEHLKDYLNKGALNLKIFAHVKTVEIVKNFEK